VQISEQADPPYCMQENEQGGLQSELLQVRDGGLGFGSTCCAAAKVAKVSFVSRRRRNLFLIVVTSRSVLFRRQGLPLAHTVAVDSSQR